MPPRALPIDDVLRNIGADLRDLRTQADLSQAEVADTLGYTRDSPSKYEAGLRQISLYDYLRLMDFYREVAPDHPGVALARRFLLSRK